MERWITVPGLAAVLVGSSTALAGWRPGVGFVVLVVLGPLVLTVAIFVIVHRFTRTLPNQPSFGERLSSLPSTLNAVTQSMGSTGLRQSGRRTTAVIRSARDTTAQVNRQPVIDLVLDVEQFGAAPVPVHNRSIVPNTALMLLAPGTRVVVYHDPVDPQQLLVAWDEPADPGRPDPQGTSV